MQQRLSSLRSTGTRLEDAKVELFYHLQGAGSSYERIPMGIFEISEANRKAKCLEICWSVPDRLRVVTMQTRASRMFLNCGIWGPPSVN